MKADVMDIDGKKIRSIEMPEQFNEGYHPDLIRRAVSVIYSNRRQRYGAYKRAGKEVAISVSRRRHRYKTTYGHAISRVPRKIMSRQGIRFNWMGAFAPGMVKGRRAHPPKAEKIYESKINIKERRKAIRSALAATLDKNVVKCSDIVKNKIPIVVEDKLESLKKAKDVTNVLKKIGLEIELERTSKRKVRAGKGKMRGRKYKVKRGPLIIVSKKCGLEKAAENIMGVSTCVVNGLNAEVLMHGVNSRLVIFTENSIKQLNEKKLFM